MQPCEPIRASVPPCKSGTANKEDSRDFGYGHTLLPRQGRPLDELPVHFPLGDTIPRRTLAPSMALEKIRRGKLRWLTFTNRFDNHKSIWALRDKYQSDAKWFGKHNGIIHFRLNLIAAKAFISPRWRTILKSRSVLFFFFIPPKCQVMISTLTVLPVKNCTAILFFWWLVFFYHNINTPLNPDILGIY